MVHAVYFAVGATILILGVLSLSESVRRREARLEFWSLAVLVVLTNATTAVGTLTGSRIVGADAFFARTVDYVGPAGLVNAYATPVLGGLSGLVFLVAVRRGHFNFVPLILMTFLLVGAVAASYRGPFMYGGRLALIVVVAVVAFLRPGRPAVAGAASGLVLLAGLSGVAVALQPSFALETCARKCGAFGDLLIGIADNANSLGLLMALGVPVVYFGSARHARLLSLLVGVVGLSAGSRTASAAIIVTALVLVLSGRARLWPLLWPALTVLGGLLAMVVLPTLVPLPPNSLTGRAGLWQYGIASWKDAIWVGYGPDQWRTLVGNGPIVRSAGYSTHNQFVEVLYVTGLVGMTLFVIWMIAVRRSWRHLHDAEVALSILCPVVVVGIAERPWSFGQIDGLSWSMILTMLVAGFSEPPAVDRADPASHRRRRPLVHRHKHLPSPGFGVGPREGGPASLSTGSSPRLVGRPHA